MKLPSKVFYHPKCPRCYLMLILFIALWMAALPSRSIASSETENSRITTAASDQQSIKDRWGVEILGVRFTAKGHLLDFRYRIIDPEKAKPLMSKNLKPYLVDQKTGMKCEVPQMAKVGSLRSKTQAPTKGNTFFVLFANAGGLVKVGSKVTVVMGDFKAEDLVVQ